MVQVSCHRIGNCERFVDQVFQWLHLRHSKQRARIQFYIDVNFTEFQFVDLATIAGLATSHCVDDVLAVNRNNFLALACLACLSSLLDEKSPLPSQVHRILGATSDLSQTPCSPPILSISQDRVAQLQA